ncbi:MAG TPA: GAF and ANTAR domain-containing protein [Frankiaceae bacterium]|nr:GAF and ANTAR domain-containing protein [Frankiaceae bacterium]
MESEKNLLDLLSDFATALPVSYDVESVLVELMQSVTALLELTGSGVTLVDGQRMHCVMALNDVSGQLERVQEEHQAGPCVESVRTGTPVFVRDVAENVGVWPEYAAAAQRLGMVAVAGIPMRLGDSTIGALNLYGSQPRDWSDEDMHVASVLASMATGYIVNASKLQQQEQLTVQLQTALDSRVVIEQAKGMTARDRGVSVDDAFEHIRGHARQHNAPLRRVAEAIVTMGLRV